MHVASVSIKIILLVVLDVISVEKNKQRLILWAKYDMFGFASQDIKKYLCVKKLFIPVTLVILLLPVWSALY